MVSCIVDSLATAVAASIDRLGAIAPVDDLVVFGGGSRATPLLERIGTLAALPVRRGPTEATTLGNALAQGLAVGVFDDVVSARGALVGH